LFEYDPVDSFPGQSRRGGAGWNSSRQCNSAGRSGGHATVLRTMVWRPRLPTWPMGMWRGG